MQKLWIKEVINLFYKQQVIKTNTTGVKRIWLLLKEWKQKEHRQAFILLLNVYNVEHKQPEWRYNFGNFHKQNKDWEILFLFSP